MAQGDTIIGRLVPFTDGRMVFLARYPDAVYVGFKSAEGNDTKIKLSTEAFDALTAMVNDPDVGTPERAFPLGGSERRWRPVKQHETEAS